MQRIGLLLFSVAMFASEASGAILYSQPGTASCVPECAISQMFNNGTSIRAYDNFRLGAAASVTSVSWQGSYFGITQWVDDPPPVPSTTSWQLNFFSSTANGPGASIYAATVPVASVTSTLIGTGSNQVGAYNLNFYAFSATLPVAFEAAAGTEYWFSPASIAPDPFVLFTWSPATLTYDGTSWRTPPSGPGAAFPADYAFALAGTAAGVPEPENWALLIAGFGLIGAMARRQRAVAA